MKKIAALISIVSFIVFTTACTQKEISGAATGMEADQAAGTEHHKGVEDTEKPVKTVHAKLTGSFTVTVRELIPDYCLDDITPNVAVVTCFQDVPFTVWLGEEMTSQLIVGEQYVFEIEETDIGELLQETFELNQPSPEAVIPMYQIRIANIREDNGDEWGLESNRLQYEKVE